jgi:hypothetical protein
MSLNIIPINQKKELLLKNWHLEDLEEVPFIIEIGPVHLATSKYFYDDNAELDWNLEFHKQREGIYDYGMPNIKPNQGINIVASAFGCEYKVNDVADPWIKPIIQEKNKDDVYKLKLPHPVKNEIYKKAYNRIKFLQANSNLPLRLINVPSPLVTASLIWEYTSFITAMMIYPKEVHVLMEKVTEATIEYIKEQLQRINNLFTMGHEMIYIPKDIGVRISDDTAALLSPNLYKEFGVKYNSMISRAFGGIIIHSCGDVQNVVEAMMEVENLRGLDLTIPQTPNWESIRKVAAGKTALNLRHYYWDHGNDVKVDLAEYTKKLIEFFGRKGIFIQTSTTTIEEAKELGKKLHKILKK